MVFAPVTKELHAGVTIIAYPLRRFTSGTSWGAETTEGMEMTLVKALVPSTILTLTVAAIVGSAGSRGSYLNLQDASIGGHEFYWSWPFFLVAFGLTWVLALRLE